MAIDPSELTHQKVGVKQENDESDLDDDFPFPLQFFPVIGVRWHGTTIANASARIDRTAHAKAISAAS